MGSTAISDITAGYVTLALGNENTLYTTFNDFESGKAVVKKFTGILNTAEPEKEINFSLYPNPCADQLNIQFNDKRPSKGRIEITNAAGQLMIWREIHPETFATMQIPVYCPTPGIYTMRMQLQEQVGVVNLCANQNAL